jgi:hypothetical protein
MYEQTGSCPFIRICESYQTMLEIESKLVYNRRMFLKKKEWDSDQEFNLYMDEYSREINNIKRSTERCYSNHKRCLRYWQLMQLREKEEFDQPLKNTPLTEN